MMRYLEILEAVFDPWKTNHKISSFLFVDGAFVGVAFQQHLKALARLVGLKVDLAKLSVADRVRLEDRLDAFAAQQGIVQGTCTPGNRTSDTSLSIKGGLAACRAALRAFARTFPDLPPIEIVAYSLLDDNGQRIEDGRLQGREIARKFGKLD